MKVRAGVVPLSALRLYGGKQEELRGGREEGREGGEGGRKGERDKREGKGRKEWERETKIHPYLVHVELM